MSEHHTHSDKHEAHRRLIARLRQQADDVSRITAGLDEASLAQRIAPEKWSLKETVAHLWRVQEVFESRIEAMLTQTKPALTPYDEGQDPLFEAKLAAGCEELLSGFLGDREELVSLLDSLSSADWRRHSRRSG